MEYKTYIAEATLDNGEDEAVEDCPFALDGRCRPRSPFEFGLSAP